MDYYQAILVMVQDQMEGIEKERLYDDNKPNKKSLSTLKIPGLINDFKHKPQKYNLKYKGNEI